MGLIILNTAWWADVKAPTKSIDWRSPQQFDASHYAEYQGFIDELNQMNSPIQIRIVPDTD